MKDKAFYSSRQIKLPTTHFVVFYNGLTDMPEKTELKLSDAFAVPSEDPELELKVQILNINPGMNEDLKEKCPVLREYVIYVEKVRSYAKSLPLEKAVERAVEDCIKENVLRDFLLKQRAEVVKMSIYEYDEEREWKLMREDERELGREEERKNTEAAIKEKEDAIKEKEDAIKEIVLLCKEFGHTKEEVTDKLVDKCHINREDAEAKVKRYWQC